MGVRQIEGQQSWRILPRHKTEDPPNVVTLIFFKVFFKLSQETKKNKLRESSQFFFKSLFQSQELQV